MVCFALSFFIFQLSVSCLVNLDDCWQRSRDAQGTIQADPTDFPSGIPALADYVHSKKLKFGLYSGNIGLIAPKPGRLIFGCLARSRD